MKLDKEEQREKQREKVLLGALECFSSKGFDSAKIDDIVHESGVSKGSIYKLFKSKEEIYIQLIQQNAEELIEQIEEIVSRHKTAKDKVTALFTEYLGQDVDSIMLKSFLVQSEFELYSSRRIEFKDMAKEIRMGKVKIVSDVINEGMKNAEFKNNLDVSLLSEIFWSYVHGVITHKILHSTLPYQNLIDGQKDSFLNRLLV
ncbi:MAG TPA: TetR/AcrR family transcriptional regulator [Ureibacillus sp.]|nr:TetR/AcrR family transcriptional regulator [Ureibacillus sp.]